MSCVGAAGRGISERMRIVLSSVVVALLAACGPSDPVTTDKPDLGFVTPSDGGTMVSQAMPDFSLLDASPTSMTSGRRVSPRDHLGKISAWYFADAG